MIAYRVLERLAGAGPVVLGFAQPARADTGESSVERVLAARVRRAIEAAALRTRLRGTVLAPGDDGWDNARATFNTLDDQQPALIALPAHAADVIEVVDFAREHGLQVVPQRTGHNATPLGDLSGTVLLRTDALNGVTIDPE